MLLVAIAVHRPGAIGLEGNLTCLFALSASGIVHLSWAAVIAAAISASVSLHLNSLTFGIDSMNRSYYKNDPTNLIWSDAHAAFCGWTACLIYLLVTADEALPSHFTGNYEVINFCKSF
jgi:hypothetical protein